MTVIRACDLFCGAGGTSTGTVKACERLGLKLKLLAINHWNIAIDTHLANHPFAEHLCESLDNVDPRKLVTGGRLHLLTASPECTHHSNARGGMPVQDQSRATAWHVLRWAEALRIDNILIENVKEFQSWGPLGSNGRPLKTRKGDTYRAFINALQSLGYKTEARILNAADYGDATARERLFIMAKKGRGEIRWPEPTHSKTGEATLFGKTKQWRPAREIIDWSIPGQSIFTRKRPLKDSTMRRIVAGICKFGGEQIEPFLVMMYGTNDARSVERPLPTVTAGGNHIGVCEPFLVRYQGDHKGQNDGERRTHSLEQPLPVQDTSNRYGLCQPFIVTLNHGGKDLRSYSLDNPMPTVTTIDAWGVVEPFLMKYYGTGTSKSIDDPIDTITAKDRFGLVIPEMHGYRLDIRFRMLQPHELARAMSFPDAYKFAGNREEKVRQIGNAVAVETAAALTGSILRQYAASNIEGYVAA
jgi:DNA (cytosine-5)-methyltransferase 1